MTENDTLEAVERWFRSRGIPHFIGDYSASRDVFTRAVPTLTVVVVLELLGALDSEWAWWVNLGVAAASLAALLGVWALVNVLRTRPALARPERVGATELAFFVLLVPAIDLAAGQRLTALNTLLLNLVLVAAIYLATSYALLPITRWAAGRLWRQLGDVLGLLVRALPLLLLFVTFLFLTAEVWQVAASLDGPFLAVTMTLFVAVGVVFVVARIPLEVGAWPGSTHGPTWPRWCTTRPPPPSSRRAAPHPERRPGWGGGSGATWAWWCCSPRACRSCWSAR